LPLGGVVPLVFLSANSKNAVISDKQGLGTIVNDD
jgi:hypothetical protein